MDTFESNTHSFIIKIWLEETGESIESSTWRGHITHVPSNYRRYVDDLGGITSFIAIYLREMGVEGKGRPRGVRSWLKRRSA